VGSEPPREGNSWLHSDGPVPRLIARPVRNFLSTEAAGGIALLVATVIALVWANSPLSDSYTALWETHLRLEIGGFALDEDLRHWVNDALMAIFFFVVGMEIKRELVVGELNAIRRAALPALAAVGGMVVPALFYALLNTGGPGGAGWGIPMATDIAFAVGVLALLSDRVPSGLKVFLLSLAIVDDIGAILVIAVFYSGGIETTWLLIAGLLLALVAFLRRVNVHWVPIYVVVGSAVWLATFESGVHATIAGVALGLLTPARPTDPGGFPDVLENATELSSEPDAQSLRDVTFQAHEVVSVAERLEHVLHPWTSYLIIPLFALANAGVILSAESVGDALTSPVALGIILGLVAGKVVGITFMSWLAIKLGLGEAPPGMGWSHLVGTAAVAGIGFTVSLFITALAFEDPELVAAGKMGVLLASFAAGVLGATILLLGPRVRETSE
jgi:NhaA family Na+:H+ antiporter